MIDIPISAAFNVNTGMQYNDYYYDHDDEDKSSMTSSDSDDVQDLTSELDYLEAFVEAEEFHATSIPSCGDDGADASPSARSKGALARKCSSKSFCSEIIHTDAEDSCNTSASPVNDTTNDVQTLEETFCRNFTCCGLVLRDMHELLHHFEERHVQLDEFSDILDAEEYFSDSCLNTPNNSFVTPSFLAAPTISAFDDSYVGTEFSSEYDHSHNPLIRRVGDVEDDLGVRVLEWMHEEYERGGKRLKMMADIVSSTSENISSTPVPQASNHSDEEVDVVTIDGVSEKCILSSSDVEATDSRKHGFDDRDPNKNDKPYRCSYPGCDKAYKNPNGLKYHNLHGHCGGDDEDVDYAARLMKPYVCSYTHCFKRYKNLNGLKYHIEKSHGFDKTEANQMATEIVKKTNARYGINARSVPATVLFAAIKEHEEKERSHGHASSDLKHGEVTVPQVAPKHRVNLAPKADPGPVVPIAPGSKLNGHSASPDHPPIILSQAALNQLHPNLKTLFFAPSQLVGPKGGPGFVGISPGALASNNSKANIQVSGPVQSQNVQMAGVPAYIQALAAAGYLKLNFPKH